MIARSSGSTRAAGARALTWLRLKRGRRSLLWLGCAMTALGGAAALIAPRFSVLVIGVFAGWTLWLIGACTLAATLLLLRGRPFWGALLTSLLAIGAGIFLMLRPQTGVLAVIMLAIAVFILDGAFQLALALDLRPLRVWRLILASAMASLLAALVTGVGLTEGSTGIFGVVVGLGVMSTGLAFIAVSQVAVKESR